VVATNIYDFLSSPNAPCAFLALDFYSSIIHAIITHTKHD